MIFRGALQLLAGFAALSLLARAGTPPSASNNLHVMLQGATSAELVKLVESSGGSLTHDLHLIDAVGAKLSRAQLEQVLKSPLVLRHLDDLDVRDEPEADAEEVEACDVGGALELNHHGTGVSWRLFNKREQPARLQRIDLAWPERQGALTQISLAGKPLDQTLLASGTPGKLTLEFDPLKAPTLSGVAELKLSFGVSSHPAELIKLQNDLALKAEFQGGCSAKLAPAYTDNHNDFYYAQVVGADELHSHGVTGKGVTVAVLDSGLWEARSLKLDTSGKNRVIARYDAIRNVEGGEVFDASGHGTHMTSVLAHSGPVIRQGKPTGTFKGIAPDVSLVAVKAFDHEGQGELLDIVRGIQWVVDNREKFDIRVLNLSFASRPRWNYWLDPVNQAAMRAWASGITIVAAAGNEGPDPMTIGSPGNLPYVITVGALTDSWTPDERDDDYIPDFSSRGPTPSGHIKPDVVAPGGHITGITRPDSSLTRDYPEYLLSTGEFVMSGSSQAAALVSGIVALQLQLEPDLAPDDIKCKITSSAEPAINSDGLLAYSPLQQGHGYVSATRVVTLGRRGCGNTELDVGREIAGLEHFEGPAIVDDDGNPSLPGLNEMLSPQPADKGLSLSRKWGVKDHIERDESSSDNTARTSQPFDWLAIYLEEKSRIEALAQPSSP